MSLELYLAFVASVAVLILIPGPNVALIIANSIAHGPRYGLITVGGTASAMVLQLAVTAFGLGTLLSVLADWFEWIRWVGVAYLAYLGIRAWRAPAAKLDEVQSQARSTRAVYLRGLLVSLTNPKTLLFYGAFLPQFVEPDARLAPQLALLSATFLIVALVLDSMWALLAGQLRTVVATDGKLRNRLTGAMFLGASVGLAMARKS